MSTADHLAALRAALAGNRDGELARETCEAYAKREVWAAASVGLPLIVGVEPGAWAGLVRDAPKHAQAEALWQALAWQLGVDPRDDPAVSPLRLRAAAETLGWVLPPPLTRLLDFISRVLPASMPEAGAASEALVLAAQERETLLGAALMLVTRVPEDCVDALGYYDPQRIVRLIRQKALIWFPLAPPMLDDAAIATLLTKWLPGRGTD